MYQISPSYSRMAPLVSAIKLFPPRIYVSRTMKRRLTSESFPFPHHDIILGKPWLEKWNPIHQLAKSPNYLPHQITNIQESPKSLLVKKLEENAILPERKTPLAAGYDLTPTKTSPSTREQQVINTGIALAIPEAILWSTPSPKQTAKLQVSVEAGVIDADYRGHLGIIL